MMFAVKNRDCNSTAKSQLKTEDKVGGNGSSSNGTNPNGKSLIKPRASITPPTALNINDVQVHFPFRPYDVQVKYMSSVLTALQKSEHALLESPTGTGKTLCLLCSALAWQVGEKGKLNLSKKRLKEDGSGTQLSFDPASSLDLTQKNNNNATTTDPTSSESSLAATEPVSNKPPIIIYASRTHSQLSQVVRELKNTRYRPRHAVLGSREHTCIHPKVNPLMSAKSSNSKSNSSNALPLSASEVNNGCNKLNKERKCMYRNNLEEVSGGGTWTPPSNERVLAGNHYEQPVLDMEDLVKVGKQHRICPFYHTRSLVKDAELIFVPYNYLFDRDARETTLAEVDFKNAVLIFDEAHNLEEFASESSSFDLSSSDVAGCVGEVQRALQYLEMNPDMEQGGPKMKDNLLRLKSLFLRFEKYLIEGVTSQTNTTGGMRSTTSRIISSSDNGEVSHSGEFIFDVFREGAGITHENHGIFINFVKQVGDLIMEFRGTSASSSTGTPKLDHFVNCLKRTYGSGTDLLALARAKSYRVHVSRISGNGSGGFSEGRTISYWCFAPALAMRELSFLNVRSILITSGTLSPLPSFSLELGLQFPVQLENDHVIRPDQVFVRVLGKGVSGKELSSKFGRRDDPEYILELGNTLASLCRVIPGGVLIFFPSYSSMQNCIQSWGGPASERFSNGRGRQSGGKAGAANFFASRKRKSSTPRYSFPQTPTHFMTAGSAETSNPWKRLLTKKAIVLEPRSSSDLSDAINEFKRFLSMPKSPGCILMGVCRGKISEGIDFSDDMCRAVIVTGLPFAPYLDPKVKLKREFLDAARASEKTAPSSDGGFGSGKMPENGKIHLSSLTLSGAEWYNQQAHRAVNQAIGRVIRHRHDYGAVLLLDHRFSEHRNKEGLSKWLRPHLRDEAIGAATRNLVQFFKASKTAAEKAVHKPELTSNASRFSTREKPTLSYEDDENRNCRELSKIVVVQASSKSHKSNESPSDSVPGDDGYIQPDRVIKRYDLNDRNGNSSYPSEQIFQENNSTPQTKSENGSKSSSSATSSTDSQSQSGIGLASFYNSGRISSQQSRFSVGGETKSSTWEGLESNAKTQILRPKAKTRHSFPSRLSDETKLQAKRFFEKAKISLSPDDLKSCQRLLIQMKTHGDKKDSQLYIATAKELISLLVNSAVDGHDCKHHNLINALLPLLPLKYRYNIVKMASTMCFEKSTFYSRCKSRLSEQDFATVRKITPSLLFNQQLSFTSDASKEKKLLEDAQQILNILSDDEESLESFFRLLDCHLRKVRALSLEMKKSKMISNAKENVSALRGENVVNPLHFRPPSKNLVPSSLAPNLDGVEDMEAQKNLTNAIGLSMTVNNERKDRIMNFEKQAEKSRKRINPYSSSSKRSHATNESVKRQFFDSKSACNQAKQLSDVKQTSPVAAPLERKNTTDALDGMDFIDRCLHDVKSDAYSHRSRPNRLSGAIKSNVPKGSLCPLCHSQPKEPAMADCGHSACLQCWKDWLKRSKTCPHCRRHTEISNLARVVFEKECGSGAPSLTQICESGKENSGNHH